jgi:thioesterase domain-containing protein
MTELARTTQVCTYDRAGVGESDPAPNRKRVLDDAVRDLHQLLVAAKVTGPYVLVGSSGGGFNVYHQAGRHPKEVAGLVMLDVPAGQAKMSAEDVKALAWDAPDNPEHMAYVAIEGQMALHRLPIPAIPVTVITADAGQSATNPDEQKIWLAGSSDPVHIVLSGGHEIYEDNPHGVIDQIQKVVETRTGTPMRQHASVRGQVRLMATEMCES